MDSVLVIRGAIVDSWIERGRSTGGRSRLVLQVAPRGRPGVLMLVEAETALISDRGWLEDLGANLCHGSPVAAVGRSTQPGQFWATEIQLAR